MGPNNNSKIDVIITPTTIIPAARFDEETVSTGKSTVLETRQALLRNTVALIVLDCLQFQ